MTINRAAAAGSFLVVAIAVTAGLYLGGSPGEQRLRRIDEQRISDLNMLANVVQQYWQERGELPANLQALVDGHRLSRLPVDPETRAAYDYSPGEARFTLCAQFHRASSQAYAMDFWQHAAGHRCFEFDTAVILPPGRRPAIGAIPLNRGSAGFAGRP